nr:hypothetical protein [Nocardioides daphniae]
MVALLDDHVALATVDRVGGGVGVQLALDQQVVGAVVAPHQPVETGARLGGGADHVDHVDGEGVEVQRRGLQRCTHGEPWVTREHELVGVEVEHPVGPVHGAGAARHRGDHVALLLAVHRVVVQLDASCGLVRREHLGGAVDGGVVGDHEEVDALVEVVLHHRRDHVHLVAHHERPDDPHRASVTSAARVVAAGA